MAGTGIAEQRCPCSGHPWHLWSLVMLPAHQGILSSPRRYGVNGSKLHVKVAQLAMTPFVSSLLEIMAIFSGVSKIEGFL